MKERYKRQYDLIDESKTQLKINVIGCGGIGSFVTLGLAKMGFKNISVYDFDEVEDHNVASQFFKEDQLGEFKTIALQKNIQEQTGITINPYNLPIEEVNLSTTPNLTIIAVDSMEVRNNLAQKYKENENMYIIDGRMGGLQLEIYNCPAKEYHKTIVENNQVSHEPCTAKAISFNCMVIGGFISNLVRQFINNKLDPSLMIYLFDSNTLLKKQL